MIMSLAKPPASAGPLSRRGDYLCAARGPGLFLGIRRRTTIFPYESTVTRGPPYPLFHRRPWPFRDGRRPLAQHVARLVRPSRNRRASLAGLLGPNSLRSTGRPSFPPPQ